MIRKTLLINIVLLFTLCPSKTGATTKSESNVPLPESVTQFLATQIQKPFGNNVFVFDSSMDMRDIQTLIDTIYQHQSDKESEFTTNRYAFLFKPGNYALDVKVGYYTHVIGLGESPNDVVITGAVRSKSTNTKGHVLSNFWRAMENITIVPTTEKANVWGVSQAAPIRRVHVKGNLQLHDNGYASGGFMADSKIDGTTDAGQQQQWFTRNSNINKWNGGAWNIMFMGVPEAPNENWPKKPFTVIKKTPIIREKPYWVSTPLGYELKMPSLKENSASISWDKGSNEDASISLKEFYIAYPEKDSAESINNALELGKNILFTPGVYTVSSAIKIRRSGTIITGIGMPSLISSNGNTILEIADVDGVTVSGLLLDAGPINSLKLMQVGELNAEANHAINPTFLFDIFIRVGGPHEGSSNSAMEINSNDVIADNIWLWRADHGNGAGWTKNRCANGLIVNGDRVSLYGLFNEHFQEYQTLWNGESGKVYFYQSEMPYDVPSVEAWQHDGINGFASYKVANGVKNHEAWGVGIYNVFYNAPIIVDNAIETPSAIEPNIHHKLTFWLNGNEQSVVKSIINGKGESVKKENRKATLE